MERHHQERTSSTQEVIERSLGFLEELPASRVCGWCGNRMLLDTHLDCEYVDADSGVTVKIIDIPGYVCRNCESINHPARVADLMESLMNTPIKEPAVLVHSRKP